jgi:hypothetical protein
MFKVNLPCLAYRSNVLSLTIAEAWAIAAPAPSPREGR